MLCSKPKNEKEYTEFVTYLDKRSNHIIKHYNKTYTCIITDDENKILYNNKQRQYNTWQRYISRVINYNNNLEKTYIILGMNNGFYQSVIQNQDKTNIIFSLLLECKFVILQYLFTEKCETIHYFIKQKEMDKKICEINKENGNITVKKSNGNTEIINDLNSKQIAKVINDNFCHVVFCYKTKLNVGRIDYSKK